MTRVVRSVLPFWWLFTNWGADDERYVREIMHWFRGVEAHVLLWDDLGYNARRRYTLGCALVAEGREKAGREVLDRLLREGQERYVSPVRVSLLYLALSEYDAAFDALREAVTSRATDLIWIAVYPGFEGVHDEPKDAEVRQAIFGG